MIAGNSLRCDVVPAIRAVSRGFHVPHGQTSVLEYGETPEHEPRFRRIAALDALPGRIAQMT